MNLRPFAPGDEAALGDLWFESWSSIGLKAPVVTRADLAQRVPRELAERWDVTVADEGGKLLGFLALVFSEKRLDQLFIAPNAQGRGLGKWLLDLAKARLPEGFWLSTQPDNTGARAFYEHAGLVFDRAERSHTGERVFYVFQPLPRPP